jgi:ubiquinone/menaquinone biosynthesis C-methylase UbiE
MKDDTAIALEAYEKLAESYSQLAEQKAENGFIEHPAMRAQLGDVRGLKVLDAGCGPGILAAWLLAQGADVSAFDISPKMLELAAGRMKGAGKLFRANMAEPLSSLGPEEFDVVASSLAIDYVRDWSVPLGEFYRVLKPKGRLVFTVQHPIGAFLWYKLDSYVGVQYAEATWKGFGGERVVMPDYYRAFEEMINPLIGAGFVLRKILDTKPVEALKAREPEAYERNNRMPPFVCIEALKP